MVNEQFAVIDKYFQEKQTELDASLYQGKAVSEVFYFIMHVVSKESSSTAKLQAVFNVFVPSSTEVILDDISLVRPTVHSSLEAFLLCFHQHHISLIADVSCRHHALILDETDKDFVVLLCHLHSLSLSTCFSCTLQRW